jgi:hypothetical protein
MLRRIVVTVGFVAPIFDGRLPSWRADVDLER